MLAAQCSATFVLKLSIPVAAPSLAYFPGCQRKCHPSHFGLTHDGHIILYLEECLLAALPQDIEGVSVGHAVQRNPINAQQPVPNFQRPFPVGTNRQKLLFFFIYIFLYACVVIYKVNYFDPVRVEHSLGQ